MTYNFWHRVLDEDDEGPPGVQPPVVVLEQQGAPSFQETEYFERCFSHNAKGVVLHPHVWSCLTSSRGLRITHSSPGLGTP